MSSVISVVPPEPIAITAGSLPFIVAAFNGLILSAVLWFNRSSFGGSLYANRLLSALLLILSVLLVDHVADYTGHYYFAPYLIEIFVPLPFLIGPLLWGYVKAQTSPITVNFRKSHLLHLIPALFKLLIVLPFVLNGESDAKIIYFYEPWFDLPFIDSIHIEPACAWYRPWLWPDCTLTLQQVVNQPEYNLNLKSPLARIWLSDFSSIALWVSLITYICLSVVILKSHQSQLRQLTSNTHNRDLRWLTLFIVLLTLAAIVYIVISFQEMNFESTWLGYETRDYVIYILIAISVIYLGVLAIRQPVIYTDDLLLVDQTPDTDASDGISLHSEKQAAQINALPTDPETNTTDDAKLPNSKYRNSPLTPDSTRQIRARLESRFDEHRDYLDPDLSLKSLSERLNISPHILSQVINESMGVNFFDCINDYRLKDVKQVLSSNNGKQILQIATDCGFNSKSSFYAFFKKREDMTPSAWRKKYSIKNDSQG